MRHSNTLPAFTRTLGVSEHSAFLSADSFGVVFVVPDSEAAKRPARISTDANSQTVTPVFRKLNAVQLRSASARRLFSIRGETRQIRDRGFPESTNNLSHVGPDRRASL